MPKSHEPTLDNSGWIRELSPYLLLTVLTLAVYWQVAGLDFINSDDRTYILLNPSVRAGLTCRGIQWAFSSFYASNWHPLTWISHMTDVSLFGLNPGAHHLVNVAFHLANVLLLFYLLRRMTGRLWPSAAVVALFAIHPLHVESVAWVAERKDVLSCLFWFLTILAYVRWVERPKAMRYMLLLALYALGLLAKPMLVTLPIVLLLLDYWPLDRLRGKRPPEAYRLVVEKAPLFLLAAGSCVVTYLAQAAGGSVAGLGSVPLGARIANALVTYVAYIIRMVCPLNLSPIYPHPGSGLPWWQVLGSAALLAAATYGAVRLRRVGPYVTIGWLWYLITLLPVIGIVQVGRQAMADRYTYIPLIGLFVAIAWGIQDVLERAHIRPSAAMQALALALILGLAASAYFQVGYWRDSVTLFEHALLVTRGNYIAHNSLGVAYKDAGRYEQAARQFQEALAISPGFANARYNLAGALAKLGRWDDSAEQYRLALSQFANQPLVHEELGKVLMQGGHIDEALAEFREALRLDAQSGSARENLDRALRMKQSRTRHF